MKNDTPNHSHMLTDHVKLLQKAVLIHQDKFLLLKRSPNEISRPECWDLPGGNSEWPDVQTSQFGLHSEDIVREIQEETGIKIEKGRFDFEHLCYFETFFDAEKQIFSIIGGWRVELDNTFDSSSIKISHEHTEFVWVSPEQLDSYDFGGEKGTFVKQIINQAFSK